MWLNWAGRCVLVVGMGAVGQRRSLTFQRAGAAVIGIDPVPSVGGSEWGELIRGGLELKAEPYSPEIFEELALAEITPDLVLACATREVNARVVADANARRLWVASSTSEPDGGDRPHANAHLGAVCSGDFVRVAVHSGNVAPALAATLRDRIATELVPPADRLAAEAARWRDAIVADGSIDPNVRKSLLAQIGDPDRLMRECNEPGSGVNELRQILSETTGLEPRQDSHE